MNISQQKIEICKALLVKRLIKMPDHPLFHYANTQLKFIQDKVQASGKLKAVDYSKIYIGLMCARELENIDDSFCDAVYEMMTEIRPPSYEA